MPLYPRFDDLTNADGLADIVDPQQMPPVPPLLAAMSRQTGGPMPGQAMASIPQAQFRRDTRGMSPLDSAVSRLEDVGRQSIPGGPAVNQPDHPINQAIAKKWAGVTSGQDKFYDELRGDSRNSLATPDILNPKSQSETMALRQAGAAALGRQRDSDSAFLNPGMQRFLGTGAGGEMPSLGSQLGNMIGRPIDHIGSTGDMTYDQKDAASPEAQQAVKQREIEQGEMSHWRAKEDGTGRHVHGNATAGSAMPDDQWQLALMNEKAARQDLEAKRAAIHQRYEARKGADLQQQLAAMTGQSQGGADFGNALAGAAAAVDAQVPALPPGHPNYHEQNRIRGSLLQAAIEHATNAPDRAADREAKKASTDYHRGMLTAENKKLDQVDSEREEQSIVRELQHTTDERRARVLQSRLDSLRRTRQNPTAGTGSGPAIGSQSTQPASGPAALDPTRTTTPETIAGLRSQQEAAAELRAVHDANIANQLLGTDPKVLPTAEQIGSNAAILGEQGVLKPEHLPLIDRYIEIAGNPNKRPLKYSEWIKKRAEARQDRYQGQVDALAPMM